MTKATRAASPSALVKSFTYSPVGKLLSKSDVGAYAYLPAGSARPHAVSSISGGPVPAAFGYDANGNQTSGLGRTITYTAANLPASVKQGTRTIAFAYDPERQRFKQTAPEGTTLYFEAFGVRAELLGGRWTQYLTVGGAMVSMRIANAGAVAIRYFHETRLSGAA